MMSLTPEQIEDIRKHGCCAINSDWQALCDMALRAAESSPQIPPMTDEEITLLLAKEMSHAVTNGLNMQQWTLRLCRAVRGER